MNILDRLVMKMGRIPNICKLRYLAGTPVVLTRMNGPEIIDTIGTNKNGLAKVNVGQNQNDRQFEDTSKFYSIDWVSEIN